MKSMFNKIFSIGVICLLIFIGVYVYFAWGWEDYITNNADSFNNRFERFEKIINKPIFYKAVDGMPIEPYLTENIDFILDELERRQNENHSLWR